MYFRRLIACRLRAVAAAGMLLLLAACSTMGGGPAPALDRSATWVVLPFVNSTETPLAGNRAEAIARALLGAQGVGTVRTAPTGTQQEALFDGGDSRRVEDALSWAAGEEIRYALAGSVEEWRYKVGVDGEPAVGVTLSIIDVDSGETLWSGAGGRSGWSREALAAVANKLIRELLSAGLAGAR